MDTRLTDDDQLISFSSSKDLQCKDQYTKPEYDPRTKLYKCVFDFEAARESEQEKEVLDKEWDRLTVIIQSLHNRGLILDHDYEYMISSASQKGAYVYDKVLKETQDDFKAGVAKSKELVKVLGDLIQDYSNQPIQAVSTKAEHMESQLWMDALGMIRAGESKYGVDASTQMYIIAAAALVVLAFML